jgi:hypothetical protein
MAGWVDAGANGVIDVSDANPSNVSNESNAIYYATKSEKHGFKSSPEFNHRDDSCSNSVQSVMDFY